MPIKSDFPRVNIDQRQFALQFIEKLDLYAKKTGKVAIINADSAEKPFTYRNLRLYTIALSEFLYEQGFIKEDVACVISPNCGQFAIVFGAVAICGGALSVANSMFSEDELRAQVTDCGASIIFCHESLLDKVRKACCGCPPVKFRIVITDMNNHVSVKGREFLLNSVFKRNISAKKHKLPAINVQLDPILLPYSSGTTDAPKGVIITHYNLSAVCASYDHVMRKAVWPRSCRNYVPEHESLILVLPFHHVYGIFLLLKALMSGTQVVIMKQFQCELFCSLVQKYKVKMQILTPSLINVLITHSALTNYDLSSMTLVISAEAPLTNELSTAMKNKISSINHIAQIYSITELTAASHYPHLISTNHKEGAVGKLGPNLELKIVCPRTGEELRLNRLGEICVRGPVVMLGYLHKNQATQECIDLQGFLHTGDFGYVDSTTRVLHVLDCLKEMIEVSGRQIAPAALENLLRTHQQVVDCAVVGVPDDKCGELPRAFVVLKNYQKQNDLKMIEKLANFVAERVPPHKQLKGGICFCEVIPRSATGKVLRRKLRMRTTN